MSLDFKIVQASEIPEILDYEQRKLAEQILNEEDRAILSWNARWRKEALEHYIPMGWSFLARDATGKLMGYFIAQPLLFLDGNTQSLWMEHLQYSSLQARDELSDLAYRLSREKHLQKVYFPKSPATLNSTKHMRAEEWNPQVLSAKTTKA